MAKKLVTQDDYALLKARQDEFRAGYRSWRAGGLKGAKGETGKGLPAGGAAGVAGFRAGNLNWRSGGASGARGDAAGAEGAGQTRNILVASKEEVMHEDDATTAAAKGEPWMRFYLHPDSDFHRSMTGELVTHPLKSANLPAIAKNVKHNGSHANTTPLPAYARAVASFDGIICHLGVGGFHRSHEAMYVHRLLLMQAEQTADKEHKVHGRGRWGLVGLGLMPWDKGMRDAMVKQDCLYTVLGRDPESTTGTIVGAMCDFVYAPDDETGRLAVERLAHPATKIVSLTVTEKGYCLDVDGKLDTANPLVKHDLEALKGERPHSAVGTIVKALELRRLRGVGAFAVLSCDNLPGNGTLSKAMVLGFLEALGDEDLTEWVKENAAFPNTMVDRITPATRPLGVPCPFSDGIRSLCRETCGVDDEWPVIAESYSQWVVEDAFPLGRPAWEEVGALFVADVHPYEMMKLRLLNAGHSAISYCSYLIGHRYVDSAMDPTNTSPLAKQGAAANPVRGFLRAFFQEQTPTVPPVPGVDTEEYKVDLEKRFSNPYIKDTLQRLAEDGSQKLVTTMRDAALQNAGARRPTPLFALVVATWVRYLTGIDEQGGAIEIKDPRAEELTAMARQIFGCPGGQLPVSAPKEAPVAFLRSVFGQELAACQPIVKAVHSALTDIASTSTLDALEKYAAH